MQNLSLGLIVPFGPSIEAESSPEPFLQTDPEILMSQGKFHTVPTIVNVLENEAYYEANRKLSY